MTEKVRMEDKADQLWFFSWIITIQHCTASILDRLLSGKKGDNLSPMRLDMMSETNMKHSITLYQTTKVLGCYGPGNVYSRVFNWS